MKVAFRKRSSGRRRRIWMKYPIIETPAVPFVSHQFEKRIECAGVMPRVLVGRTAYDTMFHLVDLADKEIGWLGTVANEGSDYVIKEIFLFKQEVTGSSTEITGEGLANFAEEILQNRSDAMDVINSLRFWGHSHVRMQTYPSQQDEQQMAIFAGDENPWFIRGILNKLGSMRFDVFDFESGIIFRDVEWMLNETVSNGLRETIRQEIATKVTEPVYTFMQTAAVNGMVSVGEEQAGETEQAELPTCMPPSCAITATKVFKPKVDFEKEPTEFPTVRHLGMNGGQYD